ncbi:MAG: hypothetical protein V4723_09230 [Pseudomonadota bacterium]
MNAPVERIEEVGTRAIDATNPWLGLASFSEETRHYFYGREEEVGELTRRIQRKLLTVLFGQSGLGKTSILRAGIVPRLREEGYCPVYVRVDYGPGVPTASEQIKQAIMRATSEIGTWTRAGLAQPDESLWEFLHHRGDKLTDSYDEPLIPLLIFDQFEEIFTLAQTDDAGRAHALAFTAALAELVENRPPAALEARLEEDEEAVAQFDFSRTDYRVLIALREDYLAHLEGLKSVMPSITQNRMRLAPMTGTQALAAVSGPGGKLVTGEVAEAIVRFVAGGSELGNAQVEPSLLSLICRELNDKRIQAGRKEISLDLLAGSHASILTDFYERTLADQPPAVRSVIEDLLLTESGYRENVAEERVASALASAGAAPGTLALLVNRRLLRIEDRLDIRRVELTHDVLCGVVATSRAQRQEREQQVATERALVDQAKREQATHKALVRTRQVVAGCAVLFFVASFASLFGYLKMGEAEQTRTMTQASRAEAEKVVGYLLEDFYTELAPIGKIDMLRDLALRTNEYYANLPTSMRTPETEMNRALALMRLSSILASGTPVASQDPDKLADESIAIMTRLSQSTPGSDIIELNLSRVLVAAARGDFGKGRTKQSLDRLIVAVKTAAPFGEKSDASAFARTTYSSALQRLAHGKSRNGELDVAVKGYEHAMRVADIGADLPYDLQLTISFLESSGLKIGALAGRNREETQRVAEQANSIAQRALQRFPEHESIVHQVALIRMQQGYEDLEEGFSFAALPNINPSIDLNERQVMKDPDNTALIDSLAMKYRARVAALMGMGRVAEAFAGYQKIIDLYEQRDPAAFQAVTVFFIAVPYLMYQDELGLTDEREKTRSMMQRMDKISRPDDKATPSFRLFDSVRKMLLTYPDKDPASMQQAKSRGQQLIADSISRGNPIDFSATVQFDYAAAFIEMQAPLAAGNHAAAETLLRQFSDARYDAMEWEWLANLRSTHAISLAKLERKPEALKAVTPVLASLRARLDRGADSHFLYLELARALYATALAQDGGRAELLKDAVSFLDRMSPELRKFRTVKTLRDQIALELKRDKA